MAQPLRKGSDLTPTSGHLSAKPGRNGDAAPSAVGGPCAETPGELGSGPGAAFLYVWFGNQRPPAELKWLCAGSLVRM